MNKLFVTLALVAMVSGQGLLGGITGGLTGALGATLFGNGTNPLSFLASGNAAFGASTSTQLTSITVTAGAGTSGQVSLNSGIFQNIGLQAKFDVSGATGTGTINVQLTTFTGASINALAGFSPSGSASGSAAVNVNANFGFTYTTNLAPGTFTLTVTISPQVGLTNVLGQISGNLQAFYAVNVTDGSNTAYSSGSVNGNTNGFVGALSRTLNYASNSATTVSSIQFTLPPVQNAVVSFANVDLSLGASGKTIPVLPVLYGVGARVVSGAQATYAFSSKYLISILNNAETTISTTVNTAYNANIGLSAGTSASIGSSATFNGVTFTSQNTAYVGIAYDTSVSQQVNLAAVLVHNTTGIAVATGRRLVWAVVNTATNTAMILTDSVYDSASATVSVKVNHFSTYAIYSTSADGSTSTNSGASSLLIGAAAVLAVAALVF